MFLVPMSLGLLFIFIGVYLIDTNYLFLIIAVTLIMHPPSGIALLFFVGSVLVGRYFEREKINFGKSRKNPKK